MERALIAIKWTEVCIHTTNEAIEPISNIFNEFGASGVVIENPLDLQIEKKSQFGEIYALDASNYPEDGVYIKAYFSIVEGRNGKTALDQMKQRIDELPSFNIDIGPSKIYLQEVAEEDWATSWKQFYKVEKVSETITIVPSWEDYQPKLKGEKVIKLDPGMAFGTGTHPTTKLSIQTLENYLNPEDVVLDVGSGSGVLSIASILLGAKEVHAYDLDIVAVKSSLSNVKLNQLENKIHVQQNDLLRGINRKVDVIVSNILAEIIIQFVADAWNNLKDDGLFITSGIIQEKKQLVLDKLQEQGFRIESIREMDDWVSIVAKK
ncbi:50S ribosomal protein L11 methyltransferase [Cerasibacillus terrae]|uniref:50S ribosomal protein L11 methyltransferase n=1 Tax=Cerasibacillus terrae TaxID=2498845 RepID=UPI002ED95A8C